MSLIQIKICILDVSHPQDNNVQDPIIHNFCEDGRELSSAISQPKTFETNNNLNLDNLFPFERIKNTRSNDLV